MKIIYDSENNYENGEDSFKGSIFSEDVDIFSVQDGFSKKNEAPAKNQNPSVPPQAQQQIPAQTATPATPSQNMPYENNGQSVPVYGVPYGTTVPLTQEQFNFMMAQFAAMQNSQGVPMQNIQPGAAPFPQYTPYVPSQPAQVQKTETPDGAHNPGTRVLYQSEDFDKPEREPQRPAPTPHAPVFKKEPEIEQETIDLASFGRPDTKKQTSPFSIDETQMTMSQLQSMSKKKQGVQYNTAQTTAKKEMTPEEKFFSHPQNDEEPDNGKKRLPTSEIIRRAVLGISLVAIVIASGMLLNEYRLSRQNDSVMEEVSDLIITEQQEQTTEKLQDKEEEKTTERELTPEEQWAQLRADYPNVLFPQNLQLKYAKLYAINQEFVGYLSADGVNLNLPIVQADDDKKYLEKNFYKQNTKYGCPFVTHLNNIAVLDQNTVIFGHHMNNGTIFGALDKYKTIDGFKKAPLITFNTLYQDYSWKVIAAFVTNAYEKDDNGYIFRYYFTQLSTMENYSAYLSELSQRSLYDTGVDVLPTDKLLTLSTCSHEFTDARFVVVARLVRPGESTKVDVSRATVNSNPRYPQAWYDKKGKTNPYKNAFQWEVS